VGVPLACGPVAVQEAGFVLPGLAIFPGLLPDTRLATACRGLI
jgi:hypothetical protein